uniref:Sodium/calcium exchanger membrane region domain-containing protein n=1 Tax=Nicotiana tabacum TaxID=4097 RepID=A0A1S4CMR5_TOBAC|nr:PREDICTED: uncharacterized protein LOC107820557 [Nicotiana tabacum]
MDDHELITVFLQAQESDYFQFMTSAVGKSFPEAITMGEMVENGLKTSRIISQTALKAAAQAVQIESGNTNERDEEIMAHLAGMMPGDMGYENALGNLLTEVEDTEVYSGHGNMDAKYFEYIKFIRKIEYNIENPRSIAVKVVLLLLLGTVIDVVFADPLVDVVNNFSSATSIPSFFISFIVLPFATNSSEVVSAIIFACQKKLRSTSLTFSEEFNCFHDMFLLRVIESRFPHMPRVLTFSNRGRLIPFITSITD